MISSPDLSVLLGQHIVITGILAILALAICRVLRLTPATSHLLWLLILCRMMIPPVGTWPVSIPMFSTEKTNKTSAPRQTWNTGNKDNFSRLEALQWDMALADLPIENVQSNSIVSQTKVGRETNTQAQNRLWLSIPNLRKTLVYLWTLSSILVAGILAIRLLKVRRELTGNTDVEPWLADEVVRWSRRLSIRPPKRIITANVQSPFLWLPGPVTLV